MKEYIFVFAVFIIPMISTVWVKLLTTPGKPFAFLSKLFIKSPSYIRDPLFDCESCNSGQIALWFFIFYYGLNLYIIPFVFVTIYLTKFISEFYENE